MLRKALITAVLICIALVSNGTDRAAASGVVDQVNLNARPIPIEPSSVDLSACPCEPGEEFREEFHQTYPLSASGRVSLENINGAVQIKVWDSAAVQLDAIKKAYRKDRLAEAKIQVESSEDNIRIKTEYPDWNQNKNDRWDRNDNPASVEYTLTIPRKAILESIELVNGSLDIDGAEGSVKASSINGRVTARGLLGDVRLSTVNGQLQATFTQLSEAKPISLGSVNGGVTLIIPSDSNASIRAGTVHGSIRNEFGMRVKHGEYVGHNLDGQIGSGGPRIKLGNVNGSININHAQDGRTLSPATSLAIDKEKDGLERLDEDIARQVEQATATAAAIEASEAVRNSSARIAREAQREAQRQVNVALRDAQREIQRAQIEIQRETQRQIREQIRVPNIGRGKGTGSGSGVGYGDNRLSSQESKTFAVNGSPRVNVITFDGSITVHGWDKSEVMYTATKFAQTDEDLRQVGIQTEQQGAAVSVIAVSDNNHTGSANFEVWVPRRSTVHVSSGDGSLKLDGVSGDLTLRTGDGTIDVSDGGGQLQLNTGDGSINVIKFDGQLDARTGDGTIKLDGSFNALSARTGDGEISLTVPANSNFTVETNSHNDVSNQGLNVNEDIAPSKRVKRWRVGSGGKVFVLQTGEGLIVLRSR